MSSTCTQPIQGLRIHHDPNPRPWSSPSELPCGFSRRRASDRLQIVAQPAESRRRCPNRRTACVRIDEPLPLGSTPTPGSNKERITSDQDRITSDQDEEELVERTPVFLMYHDFFDVPNVFFFDLPRFLNHHVLKPYY
jgi:hypothetical protein